MGSVDGAFNVTKQDNTESLFNFGKQPVLQATASFYYHNNSQLDFYSSTDIPDGTTIALILGYEYGDLYQQNKHRFQEIRVATQQQIVQLISKNRVQTGIMFDEVAKHTMNNMGLKHSFLKQGQINHQSDIYVAFSKKKNTKDMMKLLDKGLQSLQLSTNKK